MWHDVQERNGYYLSEAAAKRMVSLCVSWLVEVVHISLGRSPSYMCNASSDMYCFGTLGYEHSSLYRPGY